MMCSSAMYIRWLIVSPSRTRGEKKDNTSLRKTVAESPGPLNPESSENIIHLLFAMLAFVYTSGSLLVFCVMIEFGICIRLGHGINYRVAISFPSRSLFGLGRTFLIGGGAFRKNRLHPCLSLCPRRMLRRTSRDAKRFQDSSPKHARRTRTYR